MAFQSRLSHCIYSIIFLSEPWLKVSLLRGLGMTEITELLRKPLLERADVEAITGVKWVALYRRIHLGLFPAPIDASHQSSRLIWVGKAVAQWCQDVQAGTNRDWLEAWPQFQSSIAPAYDHRRRPPPRSVAQRAGARQRRLAALAVKYPEPVAA